MSRTDTATPVLPGDGVARHGAPGRLRPLFLDALRCPMLTSRLAMPDRGPRRPPTASPHRPGQRWRSLPELPCIPRTHIAFDAVR
eukprot:1858663-Rhodomonas_salina.1